MQLSCDEDSSFWSCLLHLVKDTTKQSIHPTDGINFMIYIFLFEIDLRVGITKLRVMQKKLWIQQKRGLFPLHLRGWALIHSPTRWLPLFIFSRHTRRRRIGQWRKRRRLALVSRVWSAGDYSFHVTPPLMHREVNGSTWFTPSTLLHPVLLDVTHQSCFTHGRELRSHDREEHHHRHCHGHAKKPARSIDDSAYKLKSAVTSCICGRKPGQDLKSKRVASNGSLPLQAYVMAISIYPNVIYIIKVNLIDDHIMKEQGPCISNWLSTSTSSTALECRGLGWDWKWHASIILACSPQSGVWDE